MRARSTLLATLTVLTVTACTTDPQARKSAYLASGDEYAAAGKLPEAVLEYRNAVQQDPRAGDARAKLADAYLKTGDAGKALQEYVRAADLLPEDTEAHLKASQVLLLAGRYDDAKLWAERVLAKDPKNLQAQILLANSLAGLKDFDAAVAEIEEAIQLDPDRGATYTNLGSLELGRGQKEAAERAFKKAIELDGQSAAAHLGLANFYWASARWPAAEEELRKVVEIEPENVLAHRGLGNFYIATNRAPEAEPHLKKVRDLTKAPSAEFALADYYIGRNDEAAARAVLQSLAKGKETAPPAEVRLASLDRKGGQKDDAYQRLTRILEKDSTNLQALLTKTAFLANDGRLEEALSTVTLAVEKNQTSTAALFALGRVQTARRQPEAAIAAYEGVLRLNPRATDAKVALAQLHLSAGRSDQSLGLAQEVVKSQPQNAQARLTVVRGLLAKKDLIRAQAELDVLNKQFPDVAAVHYLSGVLAGLKRDEAGAKMRFARALELEPDSIEALGGLIGLDAAAGRGAEARARVDERLAKNPADPAILLLAARTYAATKDLKGTEEILRRAIQTNPTQLEPYGMLAQLYVSQRRLDEALVEFGELAKRNPKPVGALTISGMILQVQGKLKEAQERYDRALQFDPEAAVAANNLAWMYAESGENLDRALQLAQTAVRKLPDSPEITDTLGFVYYKKDLAQQAIQTLKPIVAKNPNNALYHYHLGLAYAKTGENADAKRHLTRALGLKADFEGAAEAKALLRSLDAL